MTGNIVTVAGDWSENVIYNQNDTSAVVVDQLELADTGEEIVVDGTMRYEGSFAFRAERESHARGESVTFVGELYPGVEPGEAPDTADELAEIGDTVDTALDELDDEMATEDALEVDDASDEFTELMHHRIIDAVKSGVIDAGTATTLSQKITHGHHDDVEIALDEAWATQTQAEAIGGDQ